MSDIVKCPTCKFSTLQPGSKCHDKFHLSSTVCPTCGWASQSNDPRCKCPDQFHSTKAPAQDWPIIGDIGPDDSLLLEPAPNGGWTVSVGHRHGMQMPKVIGAYTTAGDMIGALMVALKAGD